MIMMMMKQLRTLSVEPTEIAYTDTWENRADIEFVFSFIL